MHEIYNNLTVILIYLLCEIRYHNAQKADKTNWPIGQNASKIVEKQGK